MNARALLDHPIDDHCSLLSGSLAMFMQLMLGGIAIFSLFMKRQWYVPLVFCTLVCARRRRRQTQPKTLCTCRRAPSSFAHKYCRL
jgi:hypothetical protein